MTARTYTPERTTGTFFTAAGLEDLHVGQVRRDDGRVVWKSGGYTSQAAALKVAGKTAENLRRWFKHYGECWRDMEDAKAVATKAKAERRRLALRAVKAAVEVAFQAAVERKPTANPHPEGSPEHLAHQAGLAAAAAIRKAEAADRPRKRQAVR